MVRGVQHRSQEEALVAHRTARLNPFGRRLLVTRIELDGWPVARAAEAQGVSRTTAHKWVRRYRAEGWPGLDDRTSRPHRSPRRTAPATVQAILQARVERRWGPHRLGPLLGQPRSTVYAVLARSGYSRLRDADRPSGVPVRYVHDHPGSLVHQDHKKLGRIPDGGGHRMLGLERGLRNRRGLAWGYDHFEVVIDDATRLAYVAQVPDESARSASQALLDAAAWFASHGVRIERVLTDNALAYTHSYDLAVESLGARHRRTRPHRPQTNGKAERLIKTLLAEWAYGRIYGTNEERLAALAGWVDYYNTERTHTGLGGITPMEALVNNLHGNHI
jgi:transposase InsO family protein